MRFEAKDLLAKYSERRDVTIKSTGNTPRNYNSVGRDAISKNGKVIPALFCSEHLPVLLEMICGERIYKVPFAPEEYIINSQCGPGDTHGWHWDDYAFALIHVVEAPDPLIGGRVEFIPNATWDKENPEECVRNFLESRLVRSLHVRSGETYFMKTNTTMHRVSPLAGSTNRIAIVFTFASESDLNDDSIEHDTMEAIYPKDTASISRRGEQTIDN